MICCAPRPSEVAVPKRVARTASTSIDLPSGPRTPASPISGVKALEIRFGSPLRNEK
ncbi:hypothetical protein D3C81_2203900 [compost metagenome]